MRRWMQQMLGELSPGVRSFIVTESFFGIGAGIMVLILNLHLLDLGLDEKDIGQITSFGALATGILSLPASLLIRYTGRKTMLVVGMSASALSLLGFGLATSHAAVMASQFVWSIGMTAIVTSEVQLIFEYCRDKSEETKAYSLLFAIFTLFTGVGTLMGGYLPVWVGGATTIYQYSFYFAAACFAIGAIIRAVQLPKSGRSPVYVKKAGSAAGRPADGKEARRKAYGMLFFLCGIIFLSGVIFGLLNPYLNVILKYRYGMGDGAISWLLTVSGLFLFAGSLLLPQMIERLGIRKSFGLLFAGNAAFAFLLALAVPAPVFSALLLLRGGMFSMLNNAIESESMSAVPEEYRNLFAGVKTIARSGGNALAAYGTGWMLAASQYRLPFLLAGAFLIAGFVLYRLTVLPILERRQSASRT